MTNKYEAKIFPNGRIAFYKRKDLEDAIKADKELLIVCNCHTGGSTLAMGARKCPIGIILMKLSHFYTTQASAVKYLQEKK